MKRYIAIFFCSRVFVISILSMFYDLNKKSSDSEKKLVCCFFICLVGQKAMYTPGPNRDLALRNEPQQPMINSDE